MPTTPLLSQHLLDHLTTAVLWFDQELRLRLINQSAEVLLGISAKQACGLKLEVLIPQPDIYTKALRWVLAKQSQMIERNLRLNLANGHTITVDCSITPVNDVQISQGILIEFIQVDQHLRIAREENLLLQQQTVRNIIRGLAHEIKNPLGGLRGAAQLLARELTTDQHREYTDIIISEADRLQALLNRMLVPNSLPHKRWTNIHRVLMRVSQLITSEVGTQLEIHCDFDPSIPELLADSDQLLQAVLNVMRNAVQATGGKGTIKMRTRVQRQVTLGRNRHKLVVRIDITDHGPGIPAHLIDQIFYPLVTSRAEGTGLGLSIAQSLINQHQGLIECVSQPGETTFTLWLPVEPTPLN